MSEARQGIRSFLWRVWFRQIYLEGVQWLKEEALQSPEEQAINREAMRDCLSRLGKSTWFEWNDGSRLLFWRWPRRFLKEARDGTPGYVVSRPPDRTKWWSPKQEQWVIEAEASKLKKLIDRRYLVPGPVRVTVPRFSVPKGADDIRVVWDDTRNGINERVYAPPFFLLGIGSVVLRLHPGGFVSDFDVGECFHNFPLHESERPYTGVHLDAATRDALVALGVKNPVETYQWSRLLFGWRCSPFKAVSMMMRVLELIKGVPSDPDNAFQFDEVWMNLPGNADYDPSRPRVIKLRRDGLFACDLFIFVDDGRIVGASAILADLAMRQATSVLQRYGIQDAPRKREATSQRPRVWTGGITYLDQNCVRKFLSQKKWNKMRTFLALVDAGESSIARTNFASGLGFLIHASSTYYFIRPYLIGFYLALNLFRGGRDADGWVVGATEEITTESLEHLERLQDQSDLLGRLRSDTDEFSDEDDAVISGEQVGGGGGSRTDKEGDTAEVEAPSSVPVTSLLRKNVGSLLRLTAGSTPLQVLVHPVQSAKKVSFAGSDASGEGYGGRDDIGEGQFFFGYWGAATDDESSNWREMRTGVDTIRRDAISGRLQGRELFFATDNSTFERAYYKGYSSTPALYAMVEELRSLSIRGNFILHVIHVAGTRMIEVGIDGLSRGDLEIALLARKLRDSIPLGISPVDRSSALKPWLSSWLGTSWRLASPEDWHYNAHQSTANLPDSPSETWVWSLPPAAALYALEELAIARTKRRDLLRGVVLVPALMMPEWYRRFSKVVDVFFRIPAGTIPEWPANMHEALTVGIYLPSFRCQPWDWKRVGWMGGLGRVLCSMHTEGDPQARDLLHEFWESANRVPQMQESVVRTVLSRPAWQPLFRCAANGRRR